jgi:uncharacterized caspase-like protein
LLLRRAIYILYLEEFCWVRRLLAAQEPIKMHSASASKPASVASLLRLVALLAWSLIALVAAANGASAERRVALVIGNSNYSDSELRLTNPRNDAEDVAAALRKLGFEVLVETDSNFSDFGKALQQFARMSATADTSLFYYAGHAVQYQGKNYLLPTDAEVKDDIGLQYETVRVDDVRTALDRTHGIKIMVLDACRNNPVSARLAKLPAPQEDVPEPTSRTRGIGRIDKSEGLIIAYAASPGDVALDGQGRNSPFTAAFLRRLAQPGLEIETLFRRVAADVVATTHGRQRPETYVSLVSDYVLNQSDRFAWDKIKASDDPAAFQNFLKRFPSSYYGIEARYRLDALERAIEQHKQDVLRAAEQKQIAAEKHALAAAEEAAKACKEDQAKLKAIGPRDAGALQAIIDSKPCDKVKTAAQARLAALRAQLLQEARACRRDSAALDALGPQDEAGARDLMAKTTCATVRDAARDKIAAIEAKRARQAQICQRENNTLQGLAKTGTRADIEAFRRKAQCPATIAAAGHVISELAAADAACSRDNAALAAIGPNDGDSLRALLSRTACDKVKKTAQTRLAKLEAAQAKEAAVCRHDENMLKGLAANGGRKDLQALRKQIECPAVLAEVDKKLSVIAAACSKDEASLDSVAPDNRSALADLLGKTTCAEVKSAAAARIAALDQERARQDKICRQDNEKLQPLANSSNPADLEALRPSLHCPAAVATLDRMVGTLRTTCARETASLKTIAATDEDALKSFLAKSTCESTKSDARVQLAKLEAEKAQQAAACRQEDQQFTALKKKGADGRVELAAFEKKVTCETLRPTVQAALEEFNKAAKAAVNSPNQIRTAQGELKRLGCYDGSADGKLDAPTRRAWTHYFEHSGDAKQAKLAPMINDDFIGKLKHLKARVCPLVCPKGKIVKGDHCVSGAIAREEEPRRIHPHHESRPPHHVREHRHAQERPARRREAPPARDLAGRGHSRSYGGGAATTLGIGF